MTELEVLIRAKYPLIYLLSWEERRVEVMLRQVAALLAARIDRGLAPAHATLDIDPL